MVIIGSNLFPTESANDIGKRFLELPPLPDYITMKGPYVHGMMEGGIQGIELFELDKSRLAEGIEYVSNRYVAYFGISGFRYTVTVYFEAQEALKMIGLA
jgi:hypothetical protein